MAAILKERGLATSVGDEGGFAPALKSDEEAIETILEAVKRAGYEPGKDFKIAMDAASSEWKSEKGKGFYKLPKAGTEYTSEELIEHWAKLCDKYPIISIEDGLDERSVSVDCSACRTQLYTFRRGRMVRVRMSRRRSTSLCVSAPTTSVP